MFNHEPGEEFDEYGNPDEEEDGQLYDDYVDDNLDGWNDDDLLDDEDPEDWDADEPPDEDLQELNDEDSGA